LIYFEKKYVNVNNLATKFFIKKIKLLILMIFKYN